MQDLRIINTHEGLDTTLLRNDIEFLDLREPSISVEVKNRQVSGKFGTNKMGTQIGDTILELDVRFRGNSKMDYFKKEQRLKKIFSVGTSMTIAPMYSHGEMYGFQKIGADDDSFQQMYTLYHYDILVNGVWKISRDGLMGTATIQLVTENAPFRYISEKIIDLNRPFKKENTIHTYEFINEGTFTQDSKRFKMELFVTGLVGSGFEVRSNGSSFKVNDTFLTNDKLLFNGYSTRVNGRNITNRTNYGELKIVEGANIIQLETTGVNILSNLHGHIKFKEYVR